MDRNRKAVRSSKADMVRYLGVHFCYQMSVSSHYSHLGNKVAKRRGLRYGALFTIYSWRFSLSPIVKHAASGWADLCIGADLRKLRSLQRQALLTVTKPHRGRACALSRARSPSTFSSRSTRPSIFGEERTSRVGGLLIRANNEVRESREEVVSKLCGVWQARWNSSHKSRTIYAYFRGVGERLNSRWISPSYHCTQAFTGHGNCSSYLRKRRIAADESCSCGVQNDTVEHFFEPQREGCGNDLRRHNTSSRLQKHSTSSGFCKEALYLKDFE